MSSCESCLSYYSQAALFFIIGEIHEIVSEIYPRKSFSLGEFSIEMAGYRNARQAQLPKRLAISAY